MICWPWVLFIHHEKSLNFDIPNFKKKKLLSLKNFIPSPQKTFSKMTMRSSFRSSALHTPLLTTFECISPSYLRHFLLFYLRSAPFLTLSFTPLLVSVFSHCTLFFKPASYEAKVAYVPRSETAIKNKPLLFLRGGK